VSQDVTLLEGLLPHRVRWAQAVIPAPPADPAAERAYPAGIEAGLFPEEREHVANAVAKRRVEFAAVRRCARRALQELGYPPVPILPGEHREPLWPEGVVGSMTHCAGYCAAAVARGDEVSALGIDAEVHAALPDGVLDLISLESERALIAELAKSGPDAVHWDRVLFSAKESVYKAWFPLTHRWLGFEEADIELRPDGTFEARLLSTEHDASAAAPASPGVPRGFAGRWAVSGGLIATAVGEVVG
jgi:4'-phosphopantetheinyl transferase EntD